MARSLDVYLLGQFVGRLAQNVHGDMEFQYDLTWLDQEDAVALSQSLPLRSEPFTRRECRGFFGGILPEGENRGIIARNLGISAANDLAMLEAIGGECAGAVTFIPTGESLSPQAGHYQPLTDGQLAEILRKLPRRPLLAGEESVRLSLAGAQDKLAVHVTAGQILLPLNAAPSSHILKPAIGRLEATVANELLCMSLAAAIGLPVPAAEVGRVEEIDYLLVERYDRPIGEDGNPMRLHQEDFCQALGIPSETKYQDEGGPSTQDCFQLLRSASSVPALDVARLLDALIFNYLVGNCDAHGKNFSLLYRGSVNQTRTTTFAPLYDLVCTAYYPDLSRRMAMKIGGEFDPAKLYPRHFERLAEEAGLTQPMVRRRVPAMARAVKSKIAVVTPNHAVATAIADIICGNCDRTLERFR
ncbi:MAG TPA: type II toxin-antitoxin system HipA family toxin [Chthonomonadaceae bacterium]|nr:type II toxin-antitoxin system HipA family toxin [Chthonomonadaceae bacterium]